MKIHIFMKKTDMIRFEILALYQCLFEETCFQIDTEYKFES
jgi:hypothetical protein